MFKDRLFELQDKKYAEFQAKLVPTIDKECIIGVRVPEIRKLAKQLFKENHYEEFLKELPHKYYDEMLLHGLLISEIKDYDTCLYEVKRMLPHVDNWAVCDLLSPKVFRKNKAALLEEIKIWTASKEVYTCRFGMEMLMSHFLDGDFNKL